MNVKEAAYWLDVSEDTIRRMVAAGQLEHVRVRRTIRIPKPRPGFTPIRSSAA